jgi:hypothetical protein
VEEKVVLGAVAIIAGVVVIAAGVPRYTRSTTITVAARWRCRFPDVRAVDTLDCLAAGTAAIAIAVHARRGHQVEQRVEVLLVAVEHVEAIAAVVRVFCGS